MSRVNRNGVREYTETAGTGNIVLAGPFQQMLSFADVCQHGDTFPYRMQANVGTEWEEGIGTYNSTNNQIERTTVRRSSNSDLLVPFRPGRKNVYIHENTEYVVRKAASTAVSSGYFLKANADGEMEPVAPVTVNGSRGGNVALAALLTQLQSAGYIIDNTTA